MSVNCLKLHFLLIALRICTLSVFCACPGVTDLSGYRLFILFICGYCRIDSCIIFHTSALCSSIPHIRGVRCGKKKGRCLISLRSLRTTPHSIALRLDGKSLRAIAACHFEHMTESHYRLKVLRNSNFDL